MKPILHLDLGLQHKACKMFLFWREEHRLKMLALYSHLASCFIPEFFWINNHTDPVIQGCTQQHHIFMSRRPTEMLCISTYTLIYAASPENKQQSLRKHARIPPRIIRIICSAARSGRIYTWLRISGLLNHPMYPLLRNTLCTRLVAAARPTASPAGSQSL